MFEKHNVFTRVETQTRTEILLEDYSKALHIEMLTALEMSKQEILPACLEYTSFIVKDVAKKEAIGISVPKEKEKAAKLSELTESLIAKTDVLDDVASKALTEGDALEIAAYYKDNVLPAMDDVRAVADALETMVAKEYWPFPTYTELLYFI